MGGDMKSGAAGPFRRRSFPARRIRKLRWAGALRKATWVIRTTRSPTSPVLIGSRQVTISALNSWRECPVSYSTPAPRAAIPPSTSGTAPTKLGAPASIPKAGSTAYIAADSRLPVLLIANGSITFYQFETSPATPLVLPPNVQSALDNLTFLLRQAAAPPPPIEWRRRNTLHKFCRPCRGFAVGAT